MAPNDSGKVRQYRKPLNINIGLLIFGAIFVYIIICVILYFTSKHVVGYEVQQGSLSVSNIYKGVAIRTEEVFNSTSDGYVNYYAREGERVAVGNLVYTVDETGKLAEIVNSGELGENSLTDSDLMELKTEITGFVNEFSSRDFSEVYDFKYDVQGTVLKLANYNILESIDSIDKSAAGLVNFCRASKSGIIVYSTDELETLTPSEVTQETFNMENYTKTPLISNELISSGDTAYKLSLDEEWSIVIPVEEERLAELEEEEYVKVRFLKNQQISWAQVFPLHNADGTYAQLKFNNSMLSFCTDRFIDIELITNDEKGLKIPNSAIVEKEFYLVPEEFITKGGNSSSNGVMKQAYQEDGSSTIEFVPTTIYNQTETDYYVDDSVLHIGDYIVKPDSTETYPISKKASLIGVYNINKGYADFKQITILYQNEEYSIVQSGTEYGLSVYDHIVLDATTVKENDFIYE